MFRMQSSASELGIPCSSRHGLVNAHHPVSARDHATSPPCLAGVCLDQRLDLASAMNTRLRKNQRFSTLARSL